MSAAYILHTDGGARGNPGPAGAGIVLRDPNGAVVCEGGRYLGEVTNNVAEYEALIWGLETAIAHGARRLVVKADSELVVKQMKGQYRVKHPGLKPLYERALSAVSTVGTVEFVHVRRDQNKDADDLANRAMDARGVVGSAVWPACDGGQGTLFE
ncbi:MAG: ribonuclease HI family protein [Coriobacteriia bacterium]|nr:ribonuclease HI family protein [Coriobacteriia bacterium]